MKKCKFCGADVAEGSAFCSTCGARTEETPTYEAEVKSDTQNQSYAAPEQKPSRDLNVGMLVWSIINIILGFCGCVPLILGVLSAIFTLIAKDASSDEKSKQYIKTAKIINIITSVLIAVAIVVLILFVIAAILSEVPYYHFMY